MTIPTNPKHKSQTSESTMEYYIEIHKGFFTGTSVPYYWSRIKSRNGKIVWTSEMYKSKQSAEKPVLKLIKIIGKKHCSLKYYT